MQSCDLELLFSSGCPVGLPLLSKSIRGDALGRVKKCGWMRPGPSRRTRSAIRTPAGRRRRGRVAHGGHGGGRSKDRPVGERASQDRREHRSIPEYEVTHALPIGRSRQILKPALGRRARHAGRLTEADGQAWFPRSSTSLQNPGRTATIRRIQTVRIRSRYSKEDRSIAGGLFGHRAPTCWGGGGCRGFSVPRCSVRRLPHRRVECVPQGLPAARMRRRGLSGRDHPA